jgi:hypothetical protein
MGNSPSQTDGRLAVGVSVTDRLARASDARGTLPSDLSCGSVMSGQGRAGRTPFSVGSTKPFKHRSRCERSLWASSVSDRSWQAMGTRGPSGRVAITVDVAGGFTVNSFEPDPAAFADHSQRVGATRVDANATNAVAIKREIQAWYDLNPRFGLQLNSGFLVARPSVGEHEFAGRRRLPRPTRDGTIVGCRHGRHVKRAADTRGD